MGAGGIWGGGTSYFLEVNPRVQVGLVHMRALRQAQAPSPPVQWQWQWPRRLEWTDGDGARGRALHAAVAVPLIRHM